MRSNAMDDICITAFKIIAFTNECGISISEKEKIISLAKDIIDIANTSNMGAGHWSVGDAISNSDKK